ncbi:MAG: type II secretion system protein [Patescibacteria group bacterium]
MNINKLKKESGFTIIEMMVAISIFLVVILYGMQGLLNANVVHKKAQDMRSILDSLTFSLDDMSKNIRTGYNYHCNTSVFDSNLDIDTPLSCEDGYGISFEEANGNPGFIDDQWTYFVSADGKLFKSTGGTCIEGCAFQLTPDEVILNTSSGFDIIGAESPLAGDTQQPLVIIRLSGEIEGKNNTTTPFSIETAVSQRLIDIASQVNIDVVPAESEPLELSGAEAQELEVAQSAEAEAQSAEAAPN